MRDLAFKIADPFDRVLVGQFAMGSYAADLNLSCFASVIKSKL